jgi:acyl carrier protein
MEQPLQDRTAPSLIDRSADGTAYEAPQGEAEQAIAKVWQEIFSIDAIGRNDNFFELGGDSVLGMQLIEKLTERLGIELPVVTLFLNPTIREMAEIAGGARAT